MDALEKKATSSTQDASTDPPQIGRTNSISSEALSYVVVDVVQTETGEKVETSSVSQVLPAPIYRLYKRRWVGVLGLALLNIASGMTGGWFGSIASDVALEFSISLTLVNMLANAVNILFVPSCLVVPAIARRIGIRYTSLLGATLILIAGWVRFAGTARSLSVNGAYACLIVAQILSGIAQPLVQVLGTRYSELWFDLRGRTTATMILGLSQPIGSALSGIIAPIGDSRFSILVLAIISSAVFPTIFLISPAPPTPPTFSGSQSSPSLMATLRAAFGKQREGEPAMSKPERIDFAIVAVAFGLLVALTGAFGNFSNQILGPYGYSSRLCGLMSATILLSGVVAAVASAPIFDRILTHHLALSVRILLPVLMVCWIGMIFNVKADNMPALFAVLAIIGVASFILLPVALELACEVTRSAAASSALLWGLSNVFSIAVIFIEDALRDESPQADPPANMKRALIFNAALISASAIVTVIFLKGKQARRELDVQKNQEALEQEHERARELGVARSLSK